MLFRLGPITLSTGIGFPIFLLILVDLHLFYPHFSSFSIIYSTLCIFYASGYIIDPQFWPVAWWPGEGGQLPPSDNFLEALKFKRGAEIRNCQYEILHKICKIQLANKFKDYSNSGISIAIQLLKQQFLGMSPLLPFLRGGEA